MRKMNANDLLTALRGHETVTFEIRNLGSTTHETKEFEEAVSEIERALSRSRIRNTAAEPPTKEDGGTGNHAPYVIARSRNEGYDVWEEIDLAWVANNPDEYPQWTCVPEFEGGEA